MSGWGERKKRIPRRGEIVRDSDGNLGRVTRTEGTFSRRNMWVEDSSGEESHADAESDDFEIVDIDTASAFYLKYYDAKGYREGTLCTFKGDDSIPLEIIQLSWNPVRFAMTFCLRDMRKFDSPVMRTDTENAIPLFPEEFVPAESIFSSEDTGLKWRLEINLVEKERDGWTGCGSPWEFSERSLAIAEVEAWRSRLKIRRVASALAGEWKVTFPCWAVECKEEEGKILTRVAQVSCFNGSPGYFKTSIHAARAIQIVPPEDWLRSLHSSHDNVIL